MLWSTPWRWWDALALGSSLTAGKSVGDKGEDEDKGWGFVLFVRSMLVFPPLCVLPGTWGSILGLSILDVGSLMRWPPAVLLHQYNGCKLTLAAYFAGLGSVMRNAPSQLLAPCSIRPCLRDRYSLPAYIRGESPSSVTPATPPAGIPPSTRPHPV